MRPSPLGPRLVGEMSTECEMRVNRGCGCFERYYLVMRTTIVYAIGVLLMTVSTQGAATSQPTSRPFDSYVLGYDTPVDPDLQKKVEAIDADLRAKFGMTTEQTAVGVLDLEHPRLAMIHPDRIIYAASLAKVGILLAYFQTHPEAATNLDPQTQKELGMMAKQSNNEMATKFSTVLTIAKVQEVLNSYDLYNKDHGGGIWFGKHYGPGTERVLDPVGGNSHAATVRQFLRFWLWLEQGKLVSPAASQKMREIFASPDLAPDDIKFVKGLDGRDVQIVRKWGSWDNWYHDTAIITGPGRHYILVALTEHPKGDDYLELLAQRVDDLMQGK
jgi:beta-lactamase class A